MIHLYLTNNQLNKSFLPDTPVSQTQVKEVGDTWMHVPFSQILWQFSFPMTSEQLTPKTNKNSVGHDTEKHTDLKLQVYMQICGYFNF